MLQQVYQTAATTTARIGTPKDNTPYPNVNQSTGTHDARLLRHVKIAFVETPVAHRRLRLSQRQHLGMGGSIFQHLHLVVGATEESSGSNHDCADRYLIGIERLVRLAERLAHELFV